MASWIWVLIPLAAILLGGFKEWLEFKAKQDRIGASTHELGSEVRRLEADLEDVKAERDALVRRVQNLETIVTSEAWDALVDGETPILEPPASDGRRDEAADPAARTERIARRLRG